MHLFNLIIELRSLQYLKCITEYVKYLVRLNLSMPTLY